MAKKYMQILNLADFKSYGVERYKAEVNGRALRVYCSCGRVDTEYYEICPDCGCSTVTTSSIRKSYYEVDTYSSPPQIVDVSEWVGIKIENDDEVSLRLRQDKKSSILAHCHKAAQVIEEHPEILSMCNYSLFDDTKKLLERYIKEDANGIASWTISLLDKIYRDRLAPRDMEFIYKLFSLLGNKQITVKLSSILSSKVPITQIVSRLSKTQPFILSACNDASSFCNLMEYPTRFNNMNEELLSFISAYAAEGYISNPWRFLEKSERLMDDDNARKLFIKFVKEKYASFDWYLNDIDTIIDYLNAGHTFTNVKDYYLWKNHEAMAGGYSVKDLAEALVDVYANPTEAIFNLANLK